MTLSKKLCIVLVTGIVGLSGPGGWGTTFQARITQPSLDCGGKSWTTT